MLKIEPTPRPYVPLTGAAVLPIVLIGIFFLLVLAFFVWFFVTMNRGDAAGEEKQARLYRSSFLKKVAKALYSGRSAIFFPKTFGKWKE